MIQVCIISYGVWDTSQVANRPQNTICHEWRRLYWDWLFSWRLKICYQICSLLDFLDSCEHHLCSWDVLLGVLKIDPQSVLAPCYTWKQTECIIIFSDTFEVYNWLLNNSDKLCNWLGHKKCHISFTIKWWNRLICDTGFCFGLEIDIKKNRMQWNEISKIINFLQIRV